MKLIGLIGGTSWESTIEYYRILNETTVRRLGGLSSSACLLHSLDFAPVAAMLKEGRWDDLGEIMLNAGHSIARGGASFLLICSNTLHRYADALEKETGLPVLHIADAASLGSKRLGFSRVGLLGTKYLMRSDTYSGRMRERFGLDVLVPGDDDMETVDRIIFDELCRGIIRDESRSTVLRIMDGLASRGAQGIVLGCTELPLLIHREHTALPVMDTTRLHAEAAVERALAS
jgi:aspartate racemase